jgi:nicotinate dehydrogenase subunit B
MDQGVSRRAFLEGAGALVVSFAMNPIAESLVAGQGPQSASAVDPRHLESWLAIAADGRVTAHTGKCELGQGMYTAQLQLIAEELSVPIDRIRLVQCDTSITPDQGTTSGSQSTPTNFNERNLALAAATAREALLQRAATRLGVPIDRLSIEAGVISVTSEPAKRVTYGSLVEGQALSLPVNPAAKRKPAASWKVLGTSVPRADIPALVTGQLEFVHNVRVDGMLHGRVVRPQGVGATLVGVDERSVSRSWSARTSSAWCARNRGRRSKPQVRSRLRGRTGRNSRRRPASTTICAASLRETRSSSIRAMWMRRSWAPRPS